MERAAPRQRRVLHHQISTRVNEAVLVDLRLYSPSQIQNYQVHHLFINFLVHE